MNLNQLRRLNELNGELFGGELQVTHRHGCTVLTLRSEGGGVWYQTTAGDDLQDHDCDLHPTRTEEDLQLLLAPLCRTPLMDAPGPTLSVALLRWLIQEGEFGPNAPGDYCVLVGQGTLREQVLFASPWTRGLLTVHPQLMGLTGHYRVRSGSHENVSHFEYVSSGQAHGRRLCLPEHLLARLPQLVP